MTISETDKTIIALYGQALLNTELELDEVARILDSLYMEAQK